MCSFPASKNKLQNTPNFQSSDTQNRAHLQSQCLAQRETMGRTQEHSRALYHLQIASVATAITWSIYLASATENDIILR